MWMRSISLFDEYVHQAHLLTADVNALDFKNPDHDACGP
jgi:hypothetical protein